MPKEYTTAKEIAGPLLLVDNIEKATYQEIVEIKTKDGLVKRGQVLEVNGSMALIQVFEETTGLSLGEVKIKFLGHGIELGVSPQILGRIFDGSGKPIDGAPQIIPEKRMDINGAPINPYARDYPSEFIQTGISAIDGLNTLVRGQKLPIFSGSGLPHAEVAAQIARQSKVLGKEEKFAVVFAAMGISFEEANYFIESFRESGALERSIMFINIGNDLLLSVSQRLVLL